MSKSIEAIAEVVAEINKAVTANETTYQHTRNAAELAAEQINTLLSMDDALNPIMECYREVFGSNHNIKSDFKDMLVCYYGADVLISIPATKTEEELHTKAGDAVQLSRHKMRASAKQVRADAGTSRAAGGGRTPRPNAEGAGTVVDFAVTLTDLMARPEGVEKIKSLLHGLGYGLRKLPATK
jgi:hypothetical protein